MKVKMKESIGEIKLAVSYTSISAVFNEEYLEQIMPDTFYSAAYDAVVKVGRKSEHLPPTS